MGELALEAAVIIRVIDNGILGGVSRISYSTGRGE